MLPAKNRLRRSADFSIVVRSGTRARKGAVTVHLHRGIATRDADPGDGALNSSPRVGLIVGKAVGNSVVRHQVSRQLRAQLSLRLSKLPPGSLMVVRAMPTAAGASSGQLGTDLDLAFGRLLRIHGSSTSSDSAGGR